MLFFLRETACGKSVMRILVPPMMRAWNMRELRAIDPHSTGGSVGGVRARLRCGTARTGAGSSSPVAYSSDSEDSSSQDG